MLRGRGQHCETLDRLLAAVRSGESRALVVHGEAGVGKTAMLDYLRDAATKTACRVERGAGVQSEMELPYAGLHQLCAPMLDHLDRLPIPQREALCTAFGTQAGPPPERIVVGLAVLSLLAEAADERPLICLVDDAQWLDATSAPILSFAARRLGAESVALVFAVRGAPDAAGWAGLPALAVEGLGDQDARALLESVLTTPVDARVLDRIVAETRGNPLALLELPRTWAPEELAGGFGLPDAVRLTGRIEEGYRRRFDALPPATQELVLIAAAEPVGDPQLVWGAAEHLGIASAAAAPAASAGLLELGARVRFRHPLVRSAVYRGATLDERRRAHGALAAAIDPDFEPDRRAWHRAHATAGVDEEVAEQLERSAGRAQARGGLAAAAAFLERAVELTGDPERRTRCALAAATAKHQAGAPEAALALLGAAELGPLGDLDRARVDLLRAQVAFAVNRGADAPPLLLKAARRLEALDAALARETYLDALVAAMFVGRLGGAAGVPEVARAVRFAAPAAGPPRAVDQLVDALAVLVTEGAAAGAPFAKRAVAAFRGPDVTREEELRWLWLAGHAAMDVWDDEAWHALAIRHVGLAREAGALAVLPTALNTRIGVYLNTGEIAAAAALFEEVKTVNEASGSHVAPYIALAIAAFRGREDEASALIDTTMDEVRHRGEGLGLTIAEWAAALLYNGLGHYSEALAFAESAAADPADLRYAIRACVELVEAGVRSGEPTRAQSAFERLAETTQAAGTDFGLGTEARARALLSEGDEADRLYREAIERLERTRARTAVARARLLYGEWLRRERRRVDAREQLRAAHDAFSAMGMEAFAARAERELLATGETARKRTVVTLGDLTPQEAQIARLAREGLSNTEIGARLFISPRTAEYHLRKVFAKLGVSSRTQLAGALPGDDGDAAAPPTAALADGRR